MDKYFKIDKYFMFTVADRVCRVVGYAYNHKDGTVTFRARSANYLDAPGYETWKTNGEFDVVERNGKCVLKNDAEEVETLEDWTPDEWFTIPEWDRD